jgi:hypothetical protein
LILKIAPRAESSFILAARSLPEQYFLSSSPRSPGAFLENLSCLRCNRELESGQKSVAVYVFAQTVGIRPRQKSAARRICFCPQCSVSLAMGPAPEGALNLAAWEMIRELVSSDPALTAAAWEALRAIDGFLPANGAECAPRRAVGGYLEF